MHDSPSEQILCDKISAAMQRNGLADVKCRLHEKGPRLIGSVDSDEERSFAFAIARTTAGTTTLSNGIEVRKSPSK